MTLRHACFVFVLLLTACADASPRSEAVPPGAPWVSPILQDHPLAGRIWQPKTGRFVNSAELLAAMSGADFVLLGEKHDNVDHHRIQAWVVGRLAAAGRRSSVAFEMLTTEQAAALAAYQDAQPGNADGLGEAVGWAETGWPDWAYYQPIAQAALEGGGPILAAGLSRTTLRGIFAKDASAGDKALVAKHTLDRPLPPAAEESLRREIVTSHCNAFPADKAGPVARANRARDAYMASIMLEGAALDGRDGAVLIAGFGHTRLDRAVPWHLAQRAPEKSIASLGVLEVDEEGPAPEDYVAPLESEGLPFDFVWFTPRVDNEDPCEKFAEQLEQMRKNKESEPKN